MPKLIGTVARTAVIAGTATSSRTGWLGASTAAEWSRQRSRNVRRQTSLNRWPRPRRPKRRRLLP